MAKRTKAQRRAAALAGVAKRRANAAGRVGSADVSLDKVIVNMLGSGVGEAITAERGNTHGSFAQNAMISQQIKQSVRAFDGRNGTERSSIQEEAIDMIALKLSRIGSGHANHADHWVDIIGYAQLALNELQGN